MEETMQTLDASRYLTCPALDVASGVTLGVALISALPKGAPAPVRQAAKALHASTLALQLAWRGASDATPAEPSTSRRAADHALDVTWRALEQRLAAYASLPGASFPDAARAAELHARLFPDGLTFLALSYAREWAESNKRLQMVEDDKLGKSIDALAGKDFLAALEGAHAAYGVALGVTHAAPPPADVARVQEPLQNLKAAVSDYALQVVAAAKSDPSFAEKAPATLAPIDRARADNACQAGSAAPPPEPAPPPAPAAPAATQTSPIPDVPSS
jgi:hypothetical protein